MTFDVVFFFVLAIVAIGSAIALVISPNPVKSALFLIVNFFCLAVLYLLLHAQFVAVIQILVYAGAIMVLFLFVIMLLNLQDERHLVEESRSRKKLLAGVLCGTVLLEIVVSLTLITTSPGLSPQAEQIGTVEAIGKVLYTEYLFPFEVTSLLLLASLVGVVVLAKKRVQQ